jgi:hypothetical protein
VLADGAFDEMWVCEPQMGTESITLELDRSAAMDAVRLTLGLPAAFPRALAVETSTDGESWVPARRGDVVDAFIRGALASPTRPVLVLPFEPREAGFVRLRQTGADSTASWSMREVEVLARPALQTVEQVPDAGLARPSVSLPASGGRDALRGKP